MPANAVGKDSITTSPALDALVEPGVVLEQHRQVKGQGRPGDHTKMAPLYCAAQQNGLINRPRISEILLEPIGVWVGIGQKEGSCA